MAKLVPLLRDGADELEALLLESAQNDAPPNDRGREMTLRALKAGSRVAVVAGAGAVGTRWLLKGLPAAAKALLGVGIGAAAGGLGLVLIDRLETTHDAAPNRTPVAMTSSAFAATSSPVAPPSSPATQPALIAETPEVRAGEPTAEGPATVVTRSAVTPVPASASGDRGHEVSHSIEAAPQPTAPAESVAVAPPPSTQASVPSVSPPQPSSLREEAVTLESVRELLALSRGEAALSALDRYDTTFPSGALVEEAGVLRIQALLAVGKPSEARQAAAAFARRYPASSYLPRVRALTGPGALP